MQDFVAVKVVVAHLDAGFLLEILDHVGSDVVGPVVDIEHLFFLLRAGRRNQPQHQPGSAQADQQTTNTPTIRTSTHVLLLKSNSTKNSTRPAQTKPPD